MRQANEINGYISMEVVRQKTRGGTFGKLGVFAVKAVTLTAGILLLTASILLAMTIVGILPALSFGSLSVLMILSVFGRQKVECPNCGKKTAVLKREDAFTCTKCRTRIGIDWIDG